MSQLDLFGGATEKKEKSKTPPTVVAMKPPLKAPAEQPAHSRALPTAEMPAPFSHKSSTSEAAAQAIQAIAPTQREVILAAIMKAGDKGLADHEIVQVTKLLLQTINPRRGELVKLGHVVDSGRTRKTPANRDAVVWVAINRMPEGEGPMQINTCFSDESGAWSESETITLKKEAIIYATNQAGKPGFDCVEVVDDQGAVVFFFERQGLVEEEKEQARLANENGKNSLKEPL